MIKLKPCPFCGNEEIIAEISYKDKTVGIYCGGDNGCFAQICERFHDLNLYNGDIIQFYELEEIMHDFAERWNRRDTPCETHTIKVNYPTLDGDVERRGK